MNTLVLTIFVIFLSLVCIFLFYKIHKIKANNINILNNLQIAVDNAKTLDEIKIACKSLKIFRNNNYNELYLDQIHNIKHSIKIKTKEFSPQLQTN
jgi:cell division protein YceG involved in septum cleavage